MLNLSRPVFIAAATLLLSFGALAAVNDDVEPEVTARVARISFLRGDVKVRRGGADEWETATLNLPVVEGDEITTGADSRFELQFGPRTHLRADQNAYIQIKQLSDDGVAVSVSAGSVTARLRRFDADKEFFELDAPGTTIAARKEGTYRVDAGEPGGSEVRVTVLNGGEARVYSSNSGFPLRSGRSAKVFIDGAYAGEWETGDADRFSDEFDSWSAERDDAIARRLDSAGYGTYYDQDIYAADELNDNGSWEYTRDYGYVWRPHPAAISAYRDWSPYRYGSWRWVPPFGWTWVNDEPWGWATYHHGRWVWYRGRWVWTPYGYYRSNRSWWYPALVVIRVINRNVCWYPLGYRQRYYGYNRSGHHDWVGNRDRGRRPRGNDGPRDNRRLPTGGDGGPIYGKPLPSPKPRFDPDAKPPLIDGTGRSRIDTKEFEAELPATGVITVPYDEFGKGRKIGAAAPPDVAKAVLRRLDDGGGSPPELPDPRRGLRRQNTGFVTQPPQMVTKAIPGNRTGAGERRPDEPLDRELMKSRIFENRSRAPETEVRPGGQDLRRRTGAVERPVPPKNDLPDRPGERPPSRGVPPVNDQPRRSPIPHIEPPRRKEDRPVETDLPVRRETPKPNDESPRYEPPVRRDPPQRREAPPPRVDPPQRREEPPSRVEPPPRRDPPKQEQPRNDPPPRREPSPKIDPPKPESPKPPSGSRKTNPID